MSDITGEGPTRCGFVALLGAPNAGKSTLLNRLVGAKVSIVTPKVQTTRFCIRGVAMAGQSQLIFIDTPGIFAAKRRLERSMVHAAWSGAREADHRLLLVDVCKGTGDKVESILQGLNAAGQRADVALNKIDLIARPKLLAMAERLSRSPVVADIFMISAKNGDGVDDLKAHLAASLPEGPWHYPPDQLSDLPLRLMAAEITREQLFLHLHQELPYALTVETEDWQDFKDGSLRLEQAIYLQRENHKGIVLGKKGATIKAVREAAQAGLAEALERPVHLFLLVKVRENWLDDPARYQPWGLTYNV